MYKKQSPHVITVSKNEEVYICQCGKTASIPLCDGSHKQLAERVKPMVYAATIDEKLYICGCGKSADMPWCDGSHRK
jgi:CDGSH-type Zn-finger protein